MKIAHIVTFVALFGFVAGCATEPPLTSQQIASAEYGGFPSDHEKLIRDHLYKSMIDPSSVMIDNMGKPFKAYDKLHHQFGYGVYFRLNGKNQLGGYTGWKQSVAFIQNGRVLDVWDGVQGNDGLWYGSITFVQKVE